MIDRTTKLRWRRRVRRRQKQFEDIGSHTEQNLDKHFFRRLGRLYEVRRFLVTWIVLIIALISAVVVQTRALGDHYLKISPIPGGIYSEAIIGSYTNANPIFATSEVDASVSRLLFSGLLTYDAENNLTNDLAEGWSVDQSGKVYTVALRQDVLWHDGSPFTSEDVAFTYRAIQNPDTKSPLFASWSGIDISTPDRYTVVFTLKTVLASFPYSLTTGIIPQHILAKAEPSELRGSLFNTIEPVGTGPFMWNGVEVRGDTTEDREQLIALSAYEGYHKGKPKLAEFIVRAFLDEGYMLDSFYRGELNAISGSLTTPASGEYIDEYNLSLTGAVMVFLRTTQETLKDQKVRQALTHATNQKELIKTLRVPGLAVNGPLLEEHIGYNSELVQLGYDPTRAAALLDEAGWTIDQVSGMRAKNGVPLTLRLNTLNTAEYASVANKLRDQWKQVGVELVLDALPQRDLQTVIDERSYDILLYGIVMGLDPDQFAYWHSTQADIRSQRRLNFSDYASTAVDSALEAGRTRVDEALRVAKYDPFLRAWREDAPAIALYRPRFTYTTYGKVYNFADPIINTPTDRYNAVENWMVRTSRAVE